MWLVFKSFPAGREENPGSSWWDLKLWPLTHKPLGHIMQAPCICLQGTSLINVQTSHQECTPGLITCPIESTVEITKSPFILGHPCDFCIKLILCTCTYPIGTS